MSRMQYTWKLLSVLWYLEGIKNYICIFNFGNICNFYLYFSILYLNKQMNSVGAPLGLNINADNTSQGQLGSRSLGQLNDTNIMLTNQIEKISVFKGKIVEILATIQNNKAKCQKTIQNLNTQSKQLDQLISTYQQQTGSNKIQDQLRSKIRGLESQFLDACKERVRIANSLNIKNLSKIQITDKKSTANQIFKWILSCIYYETENKFFWPNFKEEAFENDKGKDFIERLGKISSANLKQEQKIKTEMFMQNFNKLSSSPEFQNTKDDINKIGQIAKLYKKGNDLSERIKQNQAQIQKHRESTMQKDQQSMRWKARLQAIKDRLKINDTYLKLLIQTQQKLQPKTVVYEQQIQNGEKLRADLEGVQKWNPSISLDQSRKSNCQCSIF